MSPSWDDGPDDGRTMRRLALALTVVALTLIVVSLALGSQPASSHLPYKTKPGAEASLTREQIHNRQSRNLHHAHYVCERGAGKHRVWACRAAHGWLLREWKETRPVPDPIPEPWYSIAVCESGSDPPAWSINTGNGFYGGLQFLTSTWLAYGGGRYASRADLASPAQQVAIASGMALTHWPVCGAPYR
jgi:hypothetical protein